MLRCAIIAVAIFVSPLLALGQISTYVESGQKKEVSWDEFIGKIVTVDGLAWGGLAKGPFAQHLVLTKGEISLYGVNFFRDELDGRLLRVSGVLRKRSVHHPDSKELLSEFHYIETLKFERIEQVKLNQLFPSPCEWLIGGMDLEAALKLVSKYGGHAYELELAPASPDETIYTFQFPMGEIISFGANTNRLLSLNKIDLINEGSKSSAKLSQLKAFEFKPKISE